jgi:glucose-1-phosphate cytidylyltransferase
MKVVILCGGYGTRIRDVSSDLPKPMVPVGRFPILWHIMKHYAHHGHREFVLCLGYKGEVIKDFFLNYRARTCDLTITLGADARLTFHNQSGEDDWQVTLADTGLDTMTGGRVRRVRPFLNGESFFLTYGDGVSDIDLGALLQHHRRQGKAMTVTGVHPPGRFGELQVDGAGLVSGFNEKPQVTEGLISGGFFVCEPRLFDYLPDDDTMMLEREPMNRLVRDRELAVYRHEGFWQAMDTARDHGFLNQLWQEERAPWRTW